MDLLPRTACQGPPVENFPPRTLLPTLIQQQAPVNATLPCIIPNYAYITNLSYDRFQQTALNMPHAPPKGNRGSKKRDKHSRPVSILDMMEQEFRFFQDEWESYKTPQESMAVTFSMSYGSQCHLVKTRWPSIERDRNPWSLVLGPW